MTMSRFLLTGAALLWAAAAAAQEPPAGNAESGHTLFVSVGCWQCHGYVGQGSTSSGPRLAPTPIAYPAFLQQLRHPSNEMPPYEAPVLSDQQAADIYTYLKTIPKPPDVKSVKLFD